MRLVHTSDWHLGHDLYNFDRGIEHEEFLAWLRRQLVELEADALVVTGDLFDSVNPPVAAQRRLYRFLHDITADLPELQIVMIAGNHDSAARVELPAPLLDPLRVTLTGGMPRAGGKVAPERVLTTLRDRSGAARLVCASVPYLRPADLPLVESGECAVTRLYREVVTAADSLRGRLPLLVTGHLHIKGAQLSELSERRILIGGEEAFSVDLFPEAVNYVALGHLHRPQRVGGKKHVRYAGAPFPMSVTEKDYAHSIVVIDFGETDIDEIRTIRIPRSVSFLRIPDSGAAPLEEVETLLEKIDVPELDDDRRPFLEVAVRLESPTPELRRRIEVALRGKPVRLTRVVREGLTQDRWHESAAESDTTLDELSPEAVFVSCHETKHHNSPSEALLKAFQEILADVENPADGENGVA